MRRSKGLGAKGKCTHDGIVCIALSFLGLGGLICILALFQGYS